MWYQRTFFFYFCSNLTLRIFIFCPMLINIYMEILVYFNLKLAEAKMNNEKRPKRFQLNNYWLCRYSCNSCNNKIAKHWKVAIKPTNNGEMVNMRYVHLNILTFFSSLSFSFRLIHSWKWKTECIFALTYAVNYWQLFSLPIGCILN